ncbi:MAG: hypothetical protein HYS22_02805 [Deltaproteobacteria bacterium]|nr:hypothetical protein [Deltaproteobacteria bacterium]
MGAFLTVARLVSEGVVAYSSDNSPLRSYPEETGKLVNSELCFEMEESGLSACFPEGALVLDLLHSVERGQARWDRSYVPSLEKGAWRVSGLKLLAVIWLPPSLTVGEEPVGHEEAGHANITRFALERLGKDFELPFYGSRGDESALKLYEELDYQDYPPTRRGNYVDYLGLLFNAQRGTTHHAMRGVKFDPELDQVRLRTMGETRQMIRKSMDRWLSEIHQIQKELDQSPVIFLDDREMVRLFRELRAMNDDFNQEQYPKVVARLKRLRPRFFYPRMRNVKFPQNDSNRYNRPWSLYHQIEPYRDLARLIQESGRHFTNAMMGDSPKGDEKALAAGIRSYKEVLRYLPEEDWDSLASGRGPLTAMGQMKLAAAIHLAQDYVAHCRSWERDVCQDAVSNNFLGLGSLHLPEDDEITTRKGVLKPSTDRAVAISIQLLKIANLPNDADFLKTKKEFLDQYWPDE